jgi:hypothetical protein
MGVYARSSWHLMLGLPTAEFPTGEIYHLGVAVADHSNDAIMNHDASLLRDLASHLLLTAFLILANVQVFMQ